MNIPYGRDTFIEVDLHAFERNMNAFRNYLPKKTGILIAVKANAYGHGAVPIARAAVKAGATYLGVAFVDEGIELRQAGVDAPILILGYTPPYALEDAIRYDLTITVFSLDQGEVLSQIAQQVDSKAKVHFKIDTGMGRIGADVAEANDILMGLIRLPNIYIEGIYTHLATADSKDHEYLNLQHERFCEVIYNIQKSVHIPLIHIANSPGAIRMPESTYNLVRLGISVYGYYPSEEMRDRVQLTPILTLKSSITHIKRPRSGSGVSYGATYKTTGEEWIATVAVGYGDGLPRALSNCGSMLVSGKRVPIVGMVCMDQLMIDVTNVMPVKVGDEVILYGKQGSEEITVDEVANKLDTIHYEITTALNHRIPRIYVYEEKVVEGINSLRK